MGSQQDIYDSQRDLRCSHREDTQKENELIDNQLQQ